MVFIAPPTLLRYVCTMVRLVYPIESETTRKTRKPTSTMWSSLKGAEAIFGRASAEAIGSVGRIVLTLAGLESVVAESHSENKHSFG